MLDPCQACTIFILFIYFYGEGEGGTLGQCRNRERQIICGHQTATNPPWTLLTVSWQMAAPLPRQPSWVHVGGVRWLSSGLTIGARVGKAKQFQKRHPRKLRLFFLKSHGGGEREGKSGEAIIYWRPYHSEIYANKAVGPLPLAKQNAEHDM